MRNLKARSLDIAITTFYPAQTCTPTAFASRHNERRPFACSDPPQCNAFTKPVDVNPNLDPPIARASHCRQTSRNGSLLSRPPAAPESRPMENVFQPNNLLRSTSTTGLLWPLRRMYKKLEGLTL
ncbi:hypothetical protein EVAR_19462_1 [Eumeta japonica]|uniref:Uncharacterized protein n=1 Tax=Eumeta variegata TaxID=151549 RepID=A0A4C1VA09_EUMVA|nr:hypothetical protein EVAR_19462_1 [Eumeta japonica]